MCAWKKTHIDANTGPSTAYMHFAKEEEKIYFKQSIYIDNGRLPHKLKQNNNIKSRPGPLSSCTAVTPLFTLLELLRGTRDWCGGQVMLISTPFVPTALGPVLLVTFPLTPLTREGREEK